MAKDTSRNLFPAREDADQKPVECLGMTFPSDEARRAYFLEKLREKLRDPAFRQVEGFPIGQDEDILALSDPPYYTACPNPFLPEILRSYSTGATGDVGYQRTPFAADISVARHDHYSLGHTYHTKVSPLAIVQYIHHFTQPGDVVLDFFAGSGMTGLAGAGSDMEPGAEGMRLAANKPRRVFLIDLSPAATHIGYGNAARFSDAAVSEAVAIIDEARAAERHLFAVKHQGNLSRLGAWTEAPKPADGEGTLEYLVWSEVLICPSCSKDVIFGEVAYNPSKQEVAECLRCSACDHTFEKREAKRKAETYHDHLTGRSAWRPLLVPLFTAYDHQGRRFYRRAIPGDTGPTLALDRGILPPPKEIMTGERYYKDALYDIYGLTHVHQFYTARNLQAIGRLTALAERASYGARRLLDYLLSSVAIKASKLMNYNADGVGRVMKGTLYQSSLIQEASFFWLLDISLRDVRRLLAALRHDPHDVVISTQSASANNIPDSSIDYVWVDPPFGKNLMYAELNQIWEWWLKVSSNHAQEAVIDARRNKDLPFYLEEMAKCFTQAYRALKPGRWITVEFHNSKNAIWNAIQEALARAGFVIADVRMLDKRLMTYKQSQQGLVKVDLIISAYKPTADVETRVLAEPGSASSAWDFIRSHLHQLPIANRRSGKVEVNVERQRHMLFDRMVAFYVQRGVPVPLSSAEFWAGLAERFAEHDQMFFLHDQVAEYLRERHEAESVEQPELFVCDEKTAISWVRRQLVANPMKYQQLQPLYMREAQRAWARHERLLELETILAEGFVQDSDGTWRVPDYRREGDLEQLRRQELLREFSSYTGSGGKLRVVRTEALRAGFKDCWQRQDYATIVAVAKRLPDAVIQEDPALLMYYDNALMRTGD